MMVKEKSKEIMYVKIRREVSDDDKYLYKNNIEGILIGFCVVSFLLLVFSLAVLFNYDTMPSELTENNDVGKALTIVFGISIMLFIISLIYNYYDSSNPVYKKETRVIE